MTFLKGLENTEWLMELFMRDSLSKETKLGKENIFSKTICMKDTS